ncbi:MAG: type IV secretory system conjugative DNA transfer family protein [Bacteroidetes bacterium]|nr:type IV secretory system conjugative DNA transfer family protein [Bacteroidota bacterium]
MHPYISKAITASRNFLAAAGQTTVDRLVEAVDYMTHEENGSIWGDADDILSPNNTGLWIGAQGAMESYLFGRNAVCTGGSGTGKTSTLIYPTLLNAYRRSYIIHDPSRKVYHDTSAALAENGYSVYLFDTSDTLHSDSINFLDYIGSPADINKLSAQIVATTLGNSASDPYWSIAAGSLLRLLLGLVLQNPDRKMHNMANVIHLLRAFAGGNAKGLDRYVVRHATPEQLMEYKAWISGAEKTTSSVVMSLSAALEAYSNPNIQRLTSTTTVDITSFRKNPSVLFLRNATMDAKANAPILSILMELFMKCFMSEEGEKGLPVSFLIDEAPGLAPLPSLSQFVSNSRKHNLSTLLIAQSHHQFAAFGEHEGKNILANMFTRMHYPSGADMQTCEDLEKVIGKAAVTDAKGRRTVQPAMPAAKLRTLAPNTGILLVGGHKPFLLNVAPYYEDPYLLSLTRKKYDPPIRNHSPDIPLILLPHE